MFSQSITSVPPFTENEKLFPFVNHVRICCFDEVLTSVITSMVIRRAKYDCEVFIEEYINLTEDSEKYSITWPDSTAIRIYPTVSLAAYEKHLNVFKEANSQYENVKAEAFLSKYGDVHASVFTKDDMSIVTFDHGECTPLLMHAITAIVYLLLPKTFSPNDLSEADRTQELEILKSLMSNRTTSFISLMRSFAESPRVKQFITDKIFSNYRKTLEENLISDLEDKLKENDTEYNLLQDELVKLLKTRTTINEQLLAAQIRANTDGGDDELAEYLKANSHVHFEKIEDEFMKFIISGTLRNFDEEQFETYSKRRAFDALYTHTVYKKSCEIFKFPDAIKRFLFGCFSSRPVFKIHVSYPYFINMKSNTIKVNHHDLLPDLYNDDIQNPHLYHHACLGTHSFYINDCLHTGNIVGALEQCISSVESINIAETSATFEPFVKELLESSSACIEYEGKRYTPANAMLQYVLSNSDLLSSYKEYLASNQRKFHDFQFQNPDNTEEVSNETN